MCSGHFPDDITVCPSCKRDDEGYRTGLSDSPFERLGDGRLKCRCGCVFSPLDELVTVQSSGDWNS